MAYVAAAGRHWGSPLAIGLGLFVGTRKLLSCSFRVGIIFDEVLNAFRWCLQPDGKAVVQCVQLPVRQRVRK